MVNSKENLINSVRDINIRHDFSLDPECNFWLSDMSINPKRNDPDKVSVNLRRYHYLLWNHKQLPNGDRFLLSEATTMGDYLYFGQNTELKFGADAIINLYTHHDNDKINRILTKLKKNKKYQKRDNEYIHKSYTIGGNIIFPKHNPSINTARGNIYRIADRIDLTLECIRIWYKDKNKETPLKSTIDIDSWFFNKFETFENYIDFFLLQDLVVKKNGKYKIKIFLKRNAKRDSDGNVLNMYGYPTTVKEWYTLYRKELKFLKKRNRRINRYIRKQHANKN